MTALNDYADKHWLRQGELPPLSAAQRLALQAARIRADWGERLACHPRSRFVYRAADHTDIRDTFAAAARRP